METQPLNILAVVEGKPPLSDGLKSGEITLQAVAQHGQADSQRALHAHPAPGSQNSRPWKLTVGPGSQWGLCLIPLCLLEEGPMKCVPGGCLTPKILLIRVKVKRLSGRPYSTMQ